MTSESHFKFTGLNVCHESQISLRVPLGMTPTFEVIQQLLYDLYAQTRYAPTYLFMAEEDIKDLTRDILENEGITRYRPKYLLAEEFGIGPWADSVITRICSPGPGRPHVVPLPDLERGMVILGFFR